NIWEENNRCLQCKRPMCKEGCPVSTPINEAIGLLRENRIKDAGELLLVRGMFILFSCPCFIPLRMGIIIYMLILYLINF
ncbi:MAG TPA: hypothetical protein DEF04_03460, partial [Clostridiales bacterium]|nr:hypothetical protein [Clostridiales bacterium]